MAKFIELEQGPQVPPPYEFPNVEINSYRLAADPFKLQVVCDRFLNIGTLEERGYQFRVIAPFVDLDYLYYPKMLYAREPYSNTGYAT